MIQALIAAAVIVSLGLDAFALSTALGVSGIAGFERMRVSLVFSCFEGVMPLAGFLLGAAVGGALRGPSNYLAAAVLTGLGLYMLAPHRDGAEGRETVTLLRRTHGLALVGLGLSISLDELAVGFGAGLLRLPILLLAAILALQALIVTQVGIRLGTRLGATTGESSERVAGGLLILAAALVLVEILFGL